jgi:nicotinamide-nucleotide amidase
MNAELSALAQALGERLRAKRAVLVTAESCTGGWVAQAVTAIAGSSEWFERGFVVYSNAAKEELLGVSSQTLSSHGAVSEETACELARGALARSRGTIALAVTGVAGPAGGSAEKPVGLVCFAWATAGRVKSEHQRFTGDREAVRWQSVMRALEGVLEMLDSA